MQAGFIAHEQGLEAVEPGIEALDDQPVAVAFGVERRVVVGLSVDGTPVARNIGFDAALHTGLPPVADVKGFVGIEGQAFQAQLGRFELLVQFGKDPLQLKCVVLVTGLGVATASGRPWVSARNRALVVCSAIRPR